MTRDGDDGDKYSVQVAADRPLGPEGRDRLGFRPVAVSLVKSLFTPPCCEGIVVAIEGEWGSGKTTLVGMLEQELKANSNKPPAVVRFEPWIVGDRDTMLTELMSDLASAVEEIAQQQQSISDQIKSKAGELASMLRNYGAKLGRKTASFARLAELVGLPRQAGDLAEGIANVLDAANISTPLVQMREDLIKGLRELDQQIVVIVDDLDRLEPAEAAEVMRLVRAVADFPNVIYLLCYHREILARSLCKALDIKDGTAFLEKVVQINFVVPRPESFDLRSWLEQDSLTLYNNVASREMPEHVRSRLNYVIQTEGQLLTTPRDVIRVINALRVYWTPVADKVDFADMVWLQMVRLNSEELYLWVEHYVAAQASMYVGRADIGDDRRKLTEKLGELISGEISMEPRSIFSLSEIFPDMSAGPANSGEKFMILTRIYDHKMKELEEYCRLSSPQHGRYYFALHKSPNSLDDKEIDRLVTAATSGEDLESCFLDLMDQKRPQGGTMFDLMVERMCRFNTDRLCTVAKRQVLVALSKCMDKTGLTDRSPPTSLWIHADRLFRRLFCELPAEERKRAVEKAFGSGAAIGWMISTVVGHAVERRGRNGGEFDIEEQWSFADDELDRAITILQRRLRGSDRDRVILVPDLIGLLFAWKNTGDEAGVNEWVKTQHDTDEAFLRFLEACRVWTLGSNPRHIIKRQNLEEFVEFTTVLCRLRIISGDLSNSLEIRNRANELIRVLAESDSDS